MMRFQTVGRHADEDLSEEFRRVGQAFVDWLEARLSDGLFLSADVMDGGGLLLIAEVDSEEHLREVLAGDPGLPRQWTITRLRDAVAVNRSVLESASADRPL
jgi:hypothetical protein